MVVSKINRASKFPERPLSKKCGKDKRIAAAANPAFVPQIDLAQINVINVREMDASADGSLKAISFSPNMYKNGWVSQYCNGGLSKK